MTEEPHRNVGRFVEAFRMAKPQQGLAAPIDAALRRSLLGMAGAGAVIIVLAGLNLSSVPIPKQRGVLLWLLLATTTALSVALLTVELTAR